MNRLFLLLIPYLCMSCAPFYEAEQVRMTSQVQIEAVKAEALKNVLVNQAAFYQAQTEALKAMFNASSANTSGVYMIPQGFGMPNPISVSELKGVFAQVPVTQADPITKTVGTIMQGVLPLGITAINQWGNYKNIQAISEAFARTGNTVTNITGSHNTDDSSGQNNSVNKAVSFEDSHTEDNSTVTEDNSTVTEDNSTVTEDNSTVTEDNSTVTEDNSTVTEDNSTVTEDNSTVTEDNSNTPVVFQP